MNILLSRILSYLNGTLFFDSNYRFCLYVTNHYLELENKTLEDVMKETGLSKEEIYSFIALLGFSEFEAFKTKLISDHMIRLDQIGSRMLSVNSDVIIKNMQKPGTNEEMKALISTICEAIFNARRVILIGPMYPISITVELQTDLVSFGKPVIQYHQFDKELRIEEGDVILFISATGRSMREFMRIRKEMDFSNAVTILITQNKTYLMEQHRISDHTICFPGRFDGIHFNYQIMELCDLIRIHYYTQYYTK